MAIERLTQLELDGFASTVRDDDPLEPEEISAKARSAFEEMVHQKLSILKEDDQNEDKSWFETYLKLSSSKIPWRIAVYVAWASVPKIRRWPRSQDALARDILGLTSDRVLISLRQKHPEIDSMISQLQSDELFEYRAGALRALGEVAGLRDYKSHQDRKLLFEMLGDYNPKIKIEDNRGEKGNDLSRIPDKELRKLAGEITDSETIESEDPE